MDNPPAHRTLGLEEAAAEFGLEGIWSEWLEPDLDSLEDTFTEGTRVLVFNGDTRFDHPVSGLDCMLMPSRDEVPAALTELCAGYKLIIVNGNLHAGYINTWGLQALFLFGDLTCDRIEFYGNGHAWIQGDLDAHDAVLASGTQDSSPDVERDGRNTVRVLGQARSPVVRTWWMRLSHLRWTADSGKEFREEIELDADLHKTDPVWRFQP